MSSLRSIKKWRVNKMGRGIWTVMKKELARFFKDRRLCLTTLLLPGLMIYVIYSFMGDALRSQFAVDENPDFQVDALYLPDSMRSLSEELPFSFQEIDASMKADALNAIQNQELDLYIEFPQAFDEQVSSYDPASGKAAPNIILYYNSSSTSSNEAYQQMIGFLDGYEDQLANRFDVNRNNDKADLADAKDLSSMTFASMMPMLIMIFLFSGCMAVAPESIAGEKERGTIATILVTPIHRSELALGKILSLSIISLLSGLSSTAGVLLSLPKLMGSAEVSVNVYSWNDYLMLGFVVLSCVLLLITMISIISAFATSIKEAQTFVMPLMILVMIIGVSGMFGSVKQDLFWYLIPLYNNVQCMTAIFSFQCNLTHILLTIGSNLLYTAAFVFLLTRMFHSERIIFSK